MEEHGASRAPQSLENLVISPPTTINETSSSTQTLAVPVSQTPSAVTTTGLATGSNITYPPEDYVQRVLDQEDTLRELVEEHRPGRSLDAFLGFYYEAMASARSNTREGLRTAPTPHERFVPDTAPVRQTRSATQQEPTSSNTTSSQSVEGPNAIGGESGEIENFEGQDSTQAPMSTRDVPTPGNRTLHFRPVPKPGKQSNPPDFYDQYFPLENMEYRPGFDVWRHVLFGIRSGMPDEVDFGLFHLVQGSYQKGDSLRFEGFPYLLEHLMEKCMEITWLCTGVMWDFERDPDEFENRKDCPYVLNTLRGTQDILQRIRMLPVTLSDDSLEDQDFSHRLRNIKEAMLILRNMVITPENAFYMVDKAPGLVRDFLCVMLNVPNQPRFNELKVHALDIAEEVTMYMYTASYDPVCISLYRYVISHDRAHIMRAVWAINHFSHRLPKIENGAFVEKAISDNGAMVGVGRKYLQNLLGLTLCDPDPEMLTVTLDFFYQFTLTPTNCEYLCKLVYMPVMFIPRMINLLSYGGIEEVKETEVQAELIDPPPGPIPKVPPELSSRLNALTEPERSAQWLRCCFVEDAGCEITQIALWQAYQIRFGARSGALAAADFIKNVSATFTNAQAQVVPTVGPDGLATTKFIIKGIRPLETALTFEGWPYLYCKWAVGEEPGHFCDRAFAEPRDLRRHVFVDHMDLEALEQPNQYSYEKAKQLPKACRWDGCTKYKTPTTEVEMVVEHVGGHLPQERDPDAKPSVPKRRVLQQRMIRVEKFCDTPVNESGEPTGPAYKAALILRNLLWHLPEDIGLKKPGGGWYSKRLFFQAHYPKIASKMMENRTLRNELSDVVMLMNQYQPKKRVK
ncbi:chromatin remodeling complex subunit (Rsc9), putative [Talaromyces stipitatus ATCC 10500]|uniref:Chromatin remodeling complex subunit (Rsc9), putative n=1 Tax=Talaromyces stipitatus (strain ATCC 10500 / CBS 375.48 / QM 6759 / NRRL 1006) TaxID=441959 RepID=B8LY69_TALSN|nr:chromatin remodeling complex subunit (Rsc9), putative [Talaromyces stipitatus ATCC 10500]EED23314.1 chromatin remodeling complex subunit (Rsc9), putative [Talaromyces stipitatus ATCC 10500]